MGEGEVVGVHDGADRVDVRIRTLDVSFWSRVVSVSPYPRCIVC